MAGGVFSGAKLHAMTVRESANDGSDFTNPDADYRRLFLGEDGLLHVKDSAGVVTSPYSGAAPAGFPIVVFPHGHEISVSQSTNATADVGRAAPMTIPSVMNVRSLWIHVTANGAAAVQWGLFDLASTLTAATKVAGGSAAPGGTGWREIAASGAPVSVAAGAYMLIIENPAGTPSTITVITHAAAPGFIKSMSTYTWDDTPDLTTGWADNTAMYLCYIEGDMDGSATRW